MTKILLFFLPLCLIWQYQTTEIHWLWENPPAEYHLQQSRINYYPKTLLKIGNQLENKIYFQILFRSIDRFFYCLNFNLHFSDFSLLFLPLFIYSLVNFPKKYLKFILVLFFLPVLLVILVGTVNSGMYAFYPLILFFNFYAVKKIFHLE